MAHISCYRWPSTDPRAVMCPDSFADSGAVWIVVTSLLIYFFKNRSVHFSCPRSQKAAEYGRYRCMFAYSLLSQEIGWAETSPKCLNTDLWALDKWGPCGVPWLNLYGGKYSISLLHLHTKTCCPLIKLSWFQYGVEVVCTPLSPF